VTGYVYLIEVIGSGVYKVGQTSRLRPRMMAHSFAFRGKALRLIGYIVTNGARRLEQHLMREWSRWRVKGERYRLPPGEVARFRSVSLLNWKDTPATTRPSADPLATPPGRRVGYLPMHIRCGEIIPRSDNLLVRNRR
jgi:hypothetical protein